MKKFNVPTMEVEVFYIEDVIATSGCPAYDVNCPNNLCPGDE